LPHEITRDRCHNRLARVQARRAAAAAHSDALAETGSGGIGAGKNVANGRKDASRARRGGAAAKNHRKKKKHRGRKRRVALRGTQA